jgi:tetratricopeptide (TPR) repeat protein
MPTDQKEVNPYVGPRPFERNAQDRARFFGRDRETQEIVSLVFSHPLVLVYAQSGAGKTSLFNAQVAPALEKKRFEVLPLTRVRCAMPKGIEPQDIANFYVFNALLNLESEADPQALVDKSLVAFLEERPRANGTEGQSVPRAIIFDQFEEIFTPYPERWYEQQEAFFHQVAEALAADPLLRMVFVIREDYIAQLDPYAPLLPEKLRPRFRLERLRQGAALSAVTGPLTDTERSFAEGVAEQLVEDLLKVRVTTAAGKTEVVAGEFVEPVQLQVVCQGLWRDLPPEVTKITQDHLQAFGDVNQALSGFYERSIKGATQEPGIKMGDLREWFEHTLITPAGTRGTVYRGQEETGGIPNVAVDVLESLHLIRGEWRAGARWYELTHDRFIEPIQESNKVWRKKRRTVWAFRAAVAILAVSLVIAFAGGRVIKKKQALENEQAVVLATGQAYDKLEQYKEALDSYKQALAIAQEIDDRVGEGATLNNIGRVYADLGQYEQALDYYRQALMISQEINDRAGEGATLNNIGRVHADWGRYEQALYCYEQALAIQQKTDDRAGEKATLNNIRAVYDALGQHEQALDYDWQALMIPQAKILPETKQVQKVQLLDADGDGKDERIAFHRFDMVEVTTGRKSSAIVATVYNDDHGAPPVLFPYELYPPDRANLGEQNCVAEVRDLILTNEGPELVVSCFAEEGSVVDLSVFQWYDHDKDDLSKNPAEGRQGYDCLGFLHSSGGITLEGSRVIVKERTEERSQLSIKRVYDVREGGYFQPGGKHLWPPVEIGIEFAFGVPEDVAQYPYPEQVVLAFYLALGQNNPLAQTYLSEASGLKNVVGSDSFGTAASGDRIQKVLVKRIIYTPDRKKEEKQEPVRVTISVASVTNAGEDPPRDVTWEVVWELPREGVAKPGWKLHRIVPPS